MLSLPDESYASVWPEEEFADILTGDERAPNERLLLFPAGRFLYETI